MSATQSTSEGTILIQNLCSLLSKTDDKDAVSKLTQYSIRMLSSCGRNSVPSIDEATLIEKLKLQLSKSNRMDDAIKLSVLHRRLKHNGTLKNRWSVLYLLYALSDDVEPKISRGSTLFRQGLASTSTPANDMFDCQRVPIRSATLTSGLHMAAPHSSRRTLETPSLSQLPSDISTGGDTTSHRSTTLPSRLGWSLTPPTVSSRQSRPQDIREINTGPRGNIPLSLTSTRTASKLTASKEQLTEVSLIRQLIYIFQGIPTQNIKFSVREMAFRLDADASVDKRHRGIVNKLCEVGWLHNRIKGYMDDHNKDKAFGLVGQAFCSALEQELVEYYRLVSVIQSQAHQIDAGFEEESALTLAKLAMWAYGPMERLKLLSALVENCKNKKGGALASMVHSFTQTGDSEARSVTRRILQTVSQPLFYIINRWIYDGELHDPFQEFFISANLAVGSEKLWYDKYRMRPSMVPSFIKGEQTQKILLVGKSINFLRLVCRDRTAIPVSERYKTFEKEFIDDRVYSTDFAAELKTHVDHAYEATSAHLLNVLNIRYKMLTHLHGLRKFLLLGQGDFIRHLLDLLQEELGKPASQLYRHNLSGPVEAAVRASNAQFEDPDVLARLDFRLLEINPGDCGWDVFSLDYHVDPPLDTLITPDVMLVYLRIFMFLWRAKRMEYNLALIWTGTMEQSRRLSPSLPQLQGVLHKGHTLAAEMVHFVHQMQYYVAFEVLECSWADLQTKMEESKDLDEVILAHHDFLQSLLKRCLLDSSFSHLLMQLRTIFDQIVKFEHLQRDIYRQATFELEARERYDVEIARAATEGVWGADSEKEGGEMARRREFRKVAVPEMRAKLKVCACAYQDMVVMFLRQLTKESDSNLRNLSWRLDFNEHYRTRDTTLRTPKAIKKQSAVSR